MPAKAGAVLSFIALLASSADGLDVRASDYALEVAFRPDEQFMEGRAEIAFAAVSEEPGEAVFYLHGELEVGKVKIGKDAVPFSADEVSYDLDYSRRATRVTVPLAGRALSDGMTVEYSGFFRASKARSPSDYMRIDADGVFLRAYYYSPWFPVFLGEGEDSHPVSFSRVSLDAPAGFTSIFVGTRVASREENGRRISEWKAEDVELKAAQCTAQRFVITEDGDYHVYSLDDAESRAVAGSILAFTKELDTRCRARYRPRATAGQVHVMQMPRFGDISSGNVVGMAVDTWNAFDRDSFAKVTLAHEFVHPFVQVPTKSSDPLHALVVEGFPSYFHLPIVHEIVGGEFYGSFLDRTEESYVRRRKTGRDRRGGELPQEVPLTKIADGDVGVYKDRFVLNDRALLFCDYLRRRLGAEESDELWREVFRRERLDLKSFEAIVAPRFGEDADDLRVWLSTTEFPERFRRGATGR